MVPQDHTLPNFNFHPSWYFIVYLAFGLFTIFFDAKQRFDQPTYPIEENDPASIIIPSFFSSQTLYLRGFLIYLAGMTGIYAALSVAGPSLVTGILKVYGIAWTPSGALDPDQWPLVLALAIVGLTPNVPGFRVPELIVRRFSHRVALIPAYARDLAFRMQRASFEYPNGARLPAGIRYRPLPSSEEAIDQNWLKICIVSARIKSFSDGNGPDSGKPLSGAGKIGLQKEMQLLYATLHDLDARLSDVHLSNGALDGEERDKLDTEVLHLLYRSYLLFSCALMGFRTRDISAETKRIGFTITVIDVPTVVPFLSVFFLLFIVLLLRDATLLLFGDTVKRLVPSFTLSCLNAANIVLTYGISSFVAFTCYHKLEDRGHWQKESKWVQRFTAYVGIWAFSYVTSLIVVSALLFTTSLPTLEALKLPIFLSLAPAVAGVLMAAWLRHEEFVLSTFIGYLTAYALIIAALAGFASLVLYQGIEHLMARVAFETTQGLVVGLAIGFLAEVTRSYQSNVPIIATSLRPAVVV